MEAQVELEKLFEGVIAGDPSAREKLFNQYQHRLRRTLWTFSRDTRYGHSDMVQSAFCHLFEDAQAGKIQLEGEHEVLGLLVRYAHNRACTGKRKDRTARSHASRYAQTRNLSQSPPDEKVEVAELVEYLRHQLSPLAAQVIELRQNGASFEQVAQQVNKSPAAVEKIYYRTLSHLRDFVRQHSLT